MNNYWKNKKIIAYIALPHHTRFISPIMDQLVRMGANVKYIVGQAERAQEITAINLNLPYSHVFDYIKDNDLKDVENNYRSLRDVFSSSLKSGYLFSLSPATVIDKTIRSTAMEYIGFRNLMQKEKPDLCFALHELNRWGKMFAFWSKKNGVPFVTMQEGLLYDMDFGYTGHVQYSTLNLVWGERVKQKLVSYEAPGDKIIPVGNTHLAQEIKLQTKGRIRAVKRAQYHLAHDHVTLLLLSAILPAPGLIMPLFRFMGQAANQKLIIKFHPASKHEQTEEWVGSIPAELKKHMLFIHSQESTYDLISMSDLCVLGKQSTTGIEALAFGKPLVKLDFAYSPNSAYSFVDQGVAVKMSPQQLAEALSKKSDFLSLVDPQKISDYFVRELTDLDHAIDRTCTIFKNAIDAKTQPQGVKNKRATPATKDWSIILPASNDPETLLPQLEAVAVQSQGNETFEAIIIEPREKTSEVARIIDSLKGDLLILPMPEEETMPSMMNKAALSASGKKLIFLGKDIAPACQWFDVINKALKKYGGFKVFGANICDTKKRIFHAGMVVDQNNAPVSAYLHLKNNYPPALKERSFQMVDHFIALDRDLFFDLGGFSIPSGSKAFLDLCLKAGTQTKGKDTVVYLPRLSMIALNPAPPSMETEESIYFYSRWHGHLWESQTSLHESDGISNEDLATEKMTSAIQTF